MSAPIGGGMRVPKWENVLYRVARGVATITLNRPEARNALDQGLLDDLRQALRHAREDARARAIVLTGAGDKAFCAGGDLGSFFSTESPLENHHRRGGLRELFEELAELGKPVIAAVNGHALAGGFGLALACDLVVAARSATFGTPEVNVGLWPMIISPVLMRNVGRKKLFELLLLGERIDAAEAERCGFVNRVVPDGEALRTAVEWAERLAEKSPAILRLGRDAFYAMADMTFPQAARYAQAMLTVNLLAEDAQEGPRAFIEKRAPRWKGR